MSLSKKGIVVTSERSDGIYSLIYVIPTVIFLFIATATAIVDRSALWGGFAVLTLGILVLEIRNWRRDGSR
jgi:hypothetical protein